MNIIYLMLICALMIFMAYTRYKLYLDNQKGLEKLAKKEKFTQLRTGSIVYIFYGLAIIGGIGFGVYAYINQLADLEMWLTVSIVIAGTAITDIMRALVVNTTYYNDEGFYNNCKYIRYKSVKNFKPKFLGVTTEVFLYDGSSHIMPTKALQTMEPYMVKYKTK